MDTEDRLWRARVPGHLKPRWVLEQTPSNTEWRHKSLPYTSGTQLTKLWRKIDSLGLAWKAWWSAVQTPNVVNSNTLSITWAACESCVPPGTWQSWHQGPVAGNKQRSPHPQWVTGHHGDLGTGVPACPPLPSTAPGSRCLISTHRGGKAVATCSGQSGQVNCQAQAHSSLYWEAARPLIKEGAESRHCSTFTVDDDNNNNNNNNE